MDLFLEPAVLSVGGRHCCPMVGAPVSVHWLRCSATSKPGADASRAGQPQPERIQNRCRTRQEFDEPCRLRGYTGKRTGCHRPVRGEVLGTAACHLQLAFCRSDRLCQAEDWPPMSLSAAVRNDDNQTGRADLTGNPVFSAFGTDLLQHLDQTDSTGPSIRGQRSGTINSDMYRE